MNVKEVRAKAKEIGVRIRGRRKAELIRAIQTAEGNDPCYQTGMDDCAEMDCCWRDDCIKTKA